MPTVPGMRTRLFTAPDGQVQFFAAGGLRGCNYGLGGGDGEPFQLFRNHVPFGPPFPTLDAAIEWAAGWVGAPGDRAYAAAATTGLLLLLAQFAGDRRNADRIFARHVEWQKARTQKAGRYKIGRAARS